MILLQEFAPLLVAMAVLASGSAFFSCSEAALFSLQADDRRALGQGSAAERAALALLERSDQLLMAILFWNLIINIIYFALASLIGIQLQQSQRQTESGIVAIVALLFVILFSEMLPKTIGVLMARRVASVVSLPLALAVRIVLPVAPAFDAICSASRRLFFPGFVIEENLALSDLEQAITISTADEELAAQERLALQNIVMLSELRAEELMRPRTQYQMFAPPVSLEDLGGRITQSGYLLVTEPTNDEVVGAIALARLPTIPRHHLERFADPVVYVPWCSTAAAILDELQKDDLEVAAIVNELGETIGIVTLADLLDTVFSDQGSRSVRLQKTSSIRQLESQLWQVTGMTSLRRLARYFEMNLPKSKSSTVAGIVQEQLGRLPQSGDIAEWYCFRFEVEDIDPHGRMVIRLRLNEA